jgi:hypothetical protein
LEPEIFESADTATLVSGALSWVGGGRPVVSTGLFGFEDNYAKQIQKTIQSSKLVVECVPADADLSKYKVVIIPSNVDLSEGHAHQKLLDYVAQGGGLAVFYNHSEHDNVDPVINRLLIIFGISFTFYILNEDIQGSELLTVPASFTFVRDANLVLIAARFKSLIKQSAIDTTILDDLVTVLRYHVMACDDSFSDELHEISEGAWDFLQRTNYSTPEGFCPEVNQSILIVLLQDLYAKVAITRMGPVPEHTIFPGPTGNVQLKEYTLTLQIKRENWTTTGLWLPPGIAGKVMCDRPDRRFVLQIGAHVESLLNEGNPWKRWPWVVTDFTITQGETEVGTPFGGITYVIANPISDEEEAFDAKFVFSNFCKVPRWVAGKPEIWEETKNVDVPWGELDFGGIIFTLPTSYMREVGDFRSIQERYDVIVNGICRYMSYTPNKPYRMVFDIELPEEGPGCAYPSVLLLDSVRGVLLHIEEPNLDLFKAVSLMAINSIREECFDVPIETAIASICAAVVFKELYPTFSPFTFPNLAVPELFTELWKIQAEFDPKLIPRSLAKFQDPSYPIPELQDEVWETFICEMSNIGKRNFVPFLRATLREDFEEDDTVSRLPQFP